MARNISSEKLTLFSYFIILIIIGTIFLSFPAAWGGDEKLSFIDALFTSVSAVCVTGLITVDTAVYTIFGKIIILLLIQAGGLGIISFTTMYLALPRGRISLRSVGLIKNSYIDSVEHKAEHIIRSIVVTTIVIELLGAVFLFFGFSNLQGFERIFNALFHSVSAFCNAGFSLFSSNLEGYHSIPLVAYPVMILIVLGGLGFVVLTDVARKFSSGGRLTFHSKLVFWITAALIVGGAALFFVFERTGSLTGLPAGEKITASFFQSITTRTAGFNTLPQENLRFSSKFIILAFMFTGGAPGSIAGGVKVTTVFLILYAAFRGVDNKGELRFGNRKIAGITVSHAHTFIMKAIIILFISILSLTISESALMDSDKSLLTIVFESFSAFGTVGLSLGITSKLTVLGKCVIIGTMFAGRVGLISIAIPVLKKWRKAVDFPRGEVLIG